MNLRRLVKQRQWRRQKACSFGIQIEMKSMFHPGPNSNHLVIHTPGHSVRSIRRRNVSVILFWYGIMASCQ